MALADINTWLNADGPFERGVALLKAHGSPTSTELWMFSRTENSVLRARLRAALQAIIQPAIDAQSARTKSVKAAQPPPRIIPGDSMAEMHITGAPGRGDITLDMLPPELKPLRLELKRLHAAYQFARGRLLQLPDGFELRRVAEQVVSMRSEMREGWAKLEMWRNTGHVMKVPEAKPTGGAERLARRNNLRTYISRHKSGKRPLTELKLAAYQAELAQLETELATA